MTPFAEEVVADPENVTFYDFNRYAQDLLGRAEELWTADVSDNHINTGPVEGKYWLETSIQEGRTRFALMCEFMGGMMLGRVWHQGADLKLCRAPGIVVASFDPHPRFTFTAQEHMNGYSHEGTIDVLLLCAALVERAVLRQLEVA